MLAPLALLDGANDAEEDNLSPIERNNVEQSGGKFSIGRTAACGRSLSDLSDPRIAAERSQLFQG